MTRKKFSDVTKLLNDLLDRYDANPQAKWLFAYGDENGFPSVEARDWFLRKLKAAERAGGIALQSRRGDSEDVVVRLADASKLYAYLERIPARERIEGSLADIYDRADLPVTAQSVIDELTEAWARGVSRFGLARDDVTAVNDALTLACALEDRGTEVIATDFRTFSRICGTDSKALERLATSVVTIHARLFPQHAPLDGLDADDVLATFGVSRTPQPLLVSGPVAVCGSPLPVLHYYGFPPDQADAITVAGPVEYVLLIENYTSFVRHVREINADCSGLVLYTGGFPARSHLRQIMRLSAMTRVPVFHWGDLDSGGMRIFLHLENALRAQEVRLQPHLMSPTLLRSRGVPVKGDRRLIAGGCGDSAIAELWTTLCETSLVLEQESLAPERPKLI